MKNKRIEHYGKNDLKLGDIISFHDWYVGGFLFGIIVEKEDDYYHNKLNIWRPMALYCLQTHEKDCIRLIVNEKDVEEYRLHDFQDLIKDALDNGVYYTLEN